MYGYETDMAGINNYPCSLHICEYKLWGSGYQNAYFISNSDFKIGGSDLTKWGIEVPSQNTLWIWDKDPLPICK